MTRFLIVTWLATVLLTPRAAVCAEAPASLTADVIIYGGTSGGVVAAVQAARMGKTVILLEPSQHLGGMTAGGLSRTDIGNAPDRTRAIGGLTREVYQRIGAAYGMKPGTEFDPPKSTDATPTGVDFAKPPSLSFEPKMAERISTNSSPKWSVRSALTPGSPLSRSRATASPASPPPMAYASAAAFSSTHPRRRYPRRGRRLLHARARSQLAIRRNRQRHPRSRAQTGGGQVRSPHRSLPHRRRPRQRTVALPPPIRRTRRSRRRRPSHPELQLPRLPHRSPRQSSPHRAANKLRQCKPSPIRNSANASSSTAKC